MSGQKTRLIFIDNFLTALFMRTHYESNGWDHGREVLVYTTPVYHISEIRVQREDAAKALWKGMDLEWVSCPIEYQSCQQGRQGWKEFFSLRELRRVRFNSISGVFRKSGIVSRDVSEIWCGENDPWVHYLRCLFPDTKFYFFEHGISDVRNAVNFCFLVDSANFFVRILKGVKRILKSFFLKVVLYFEEEALSGGVHVSLFAEDIRAVNGKIDCLQLKWQELPRLAASCVDGQCKEFFVRLSGGTAVILMTDLRSFYDDVQGSAQYYADLEQYLWDNRRQIFEPFGITNIVFKGLGREGHISDGVGRMSMLSRDYHLIVLADICSEAAFMYPFEYYLDVIKPKVLCSVNFSSSLFYDKKMDPLLHTVSFVDWFLDYSIKHYGKTFWDFFWLVGFVWGEQYKTFEKVLPVRLKSDEPFDYGIVEKMDVVLDRNQCLVAQLRSQDA